MMHKEGLLYAINKIIIESIIYKNLNIGKMDISISGF
jgi:hypothetical protein